MYQGSLTTRLSGDAWKDAVATAAVYAIFIAGIPLVRANWHHIQEQMQASGITFFYRLGNTYETTIRFQKPVSEISLVSVCDREKRNANKGWVVSRSLKAQLHEIADSSP